MSDATRPILAVVPFGSRDPDQRTSAVARQLARRVVERLERSALLEARPVFVVALSDDGTASGLLVFGSAPEPRLAAQYARGVGATHALFGSVDEGTLHATLATASDATIVATFDVPAGGDALPLAEGELVLGVAAALGIGLGEEARGRLPGPPTTDPDAYRALLVGMDLEMSSTVLRRDRPQEATGSELGAIGSYLAALRADPGCVPAEERLLFIAAERMERGEAEPAMSLLEDVITASPRSWRAHYMLGELRARSGLAAQAVVAFEYADALHPLSDADRIRVARLYGETDALDSALAKLRRIPSSSPAYGEAQEETGAALMRRGDLAGAVAAFERAKTSGRATALLAARLGQSRAALGDPARARAAFEEGLAGADRAWQLSAAYAAFLHAEGELGRAAALYRDAIGLGAPPITRLNLARALIVAGERDAAAGELRGLLADGADADTLGQARRLLFGLERPEDERRLEEAGQIAVGAREGDVGAARDTLVELAASVPDLWETHFGLGLAARRLGDAAAAEAALRRALALQPAQPDALHELGVALLMQGKVDAAVEELEQAMRVRPDDAGYVADAGFAHMLAGNYIAAHARLDRARELDPSDEITARYTAELEKRETAGREA